MTEYDEQVPDQFEEDANHSHNLPSLMEDRSLALAGLGLV
jgi:hypothetical protein